MTKSIINYLDYFGINQDEVMVKVLKKLDKTGKYDIHCDVAWGVIAIPLNQTETRATLLAHLDTICDHRDTGYDDYEFTIKNGYLQLSDKSKEKTMSIGNYNHYLKRWNTTSVAKTQCLGADDRSGVATIMAVLDTLEEQERDDYPIIMFCRDEEVGGHTDLMYKYIEEQQLDVDTNLMIEIDTPKWSTDTFREFGFGSHKGDPRLKKMLERFGYIEHQGVAVTDIATLGESLDVASISVAASYENEHTPEERLNISEWTKNFERLMQLYNKIIGREFTDFDYKYRYTPSTWASNWTAGWERAYPSYADDRDIISINNGYSENSSYWNEEAELFDDSEVMTDEKLFMEDLISLVDCYQLEESAKNHIIEYAQKVLDLDKEGEVQ